MFGRAKEKTTFLLQRPKRIPELGFRIRSVVCHHYAMPVVRFIEREKHSGDTVKTCVTHDPVEEYLSVCVRVLPGD